MPNILQRALSIFKDEPKPAAPAPTGEVAWSESQVYGSRDFQKYNPDTLIGARGFRIYRKMMLDEQVKAVVHFKRDAITSRQWYFEFDDEQKEALGEEEAERRVRVFTLAVKKMPGSFVDGLNAMMSAMYHGYSLTEKVYDQRPLPEVDGKEYVVLKALKMRPFDTFNFYPDVYGNIEKLTQTVDFREQEVDIGRFVHFVCNPDVDPHYGQSELREAYRAWFSKDHAIKFRNIFLERMAGGLISLETEKGITITQGSPAHTDIMNLLANVQTKTGWLLPAGIKANIHYPGGKNENYEAAIAGDDKAIAKALLVPPLLGLSEQGNVGAYSQSQTQLEAFMWTLDGTATRLSETCNEQVFTEIGDLNFGDGVYPRFCFHPLSESMKHMIIGKWKELVAAGAVEATDTDEGHLRELLDFPEKGEPIKKPVAVDPSTGLPLPPGARQGDDGEPELDENGKSKKKAPIGQASDRYEAQRKKTFRVAFERASKRVDFAVIDQRASVLETSTIGRLTMLMKEIGADLIEQTKAQGLTVTLVDELAIKASLKTQMRQAVMRLLRDGWNLGQDHAKREVEKALASNAPATKRLSRASVLMAAQSLTEQAAQLFLEQRSYQIAGDVSENLRKRVVTTIFNGIKNSWALDEVVRRISEEVDSYSLPQLNTVVRTTTFEAMNEARYNFFSTPELGGFVEALEYSAILDGRTTDICRELDGRIYPADSDVWNTYRPPNHFNCRSLLVAVTQLDTWQESDAPELLPAEGFG